jgi:hypothetical protein
MQSLSSEHARACGLRHRVGGGGLACACAVAVVLYMSLYLLYLAERDAYRMTLEVPLQLFVYAICRRGAVPDEFTGRGAGSRWHVAFPFCFGLSELRETTSDV